MSAASWGLELNGWAMFCCKTQTNTLKNYKNVFWKSKKCFVCVSFLHGEGDGEQSRVQLNGILKVGTKKQKKKLTCKTQTNTFEDHKNTS